MRSYKKVALHRTVVVNLRSGRAIKGVLTDETGPLLVIREAEVHEPGSAGTTPADGQIVVDRAQVDYVQVVN